MIMMMMMIATILYNWRKEGNIEKRMKKKR
jgi:hypothetical protein